MRFVSVFMRLRVIGAMCGELTPEREQVSVPLLRHLLLWRQYCHSPSRHRATFQTIRAVFRFLDSNHDGIISITDIGSKINPQVLISWFHALRALSPSVSQGHPAVEEGRMSPMDLLSEIILTFEVSGTAKATVCDACCDCNAGWAGRGLCSGWKDHRR